MFKRLTDLRDEIFKLIEINYIADRIDLFFKYDLNMKDINNEVDVIIENFDKEYEIDYMYMLKEELKLLEKRLQSNKANWMNEIIEENNESFKKQIDIVKTKLSLKKESAMKEFACKDIEEYIEKEKEKIREWNKDSNSFLIDFPYLLSKGSLSINTALSNDLQGVVLSFVKSEIDKIKEMKEENKESILIRSLTSLNNPVSDGVFYQITSVNDCAEVNIERNGKHTHIDIYHVNDDFSLTTILDYQEDDLDNVNDKDKRRVVSRLHQKDMEMLDFVLSYDPEKLYKRESVIIPIRDMVKELFASDSSASYRHTELALHKLKMLNFTINDKKRSIKHSFSLLDSVKTYNSEDTGLRMASIEISNKLYRDIIEGRTIKLFKKSIDSLETNFSKGIVFKLQARRINKLISKDEPNREYREEDSIEELDIDFFRQIVYMNKDNYYRNVKKIEGALDELVEKKLIIESYKRKMDVFTVKYLPIKPNEMQELVGSSGEIIEVLSDELKSN